MVSEGASPWGRGRSEFTDSKEKLTRKFRKAGSTQDLEGEALIFFASSEKALQGNTLKNKGEASLLTVGAFLLTVKLLCLQSLKAPIRRAFPL